MVKVLEAAKNETGTTQERISKAANKLGIDLKQLANTIKTNTVPVLNEGAEAQRKMAEATKEASVATTGLSKVLKTAGMITI